MNKYELLKAMSYVELVHFRHMMRLAEEDIRDAIDEELEIRYRLDNKQEQEQEQLGDC